MSKPLSPSSFIFRVVLVGAALLVGSTTLAVAQDLQQDLNIARCERASDLKHWRCKVTCADGEVGLATCPSLSEWGACGRQILHQACGISADLPAVACVQKVVLAGRNPDHLKSTCEQSYLGFDQELSGPFKDFPGLAYRPGR